MYMHNIIYTVLWQNRHCLIELICVLVELIHLPNCTVKLWSACFTNNGFWITYFTFDAERPCTFWQDALYFVKKLLFHHATGTTPCLSLCSTCNSYPSLQRVLLVCYTKLSPIKVIPNWSYHLQYSPHFNMWHRKCSAVGHTTYFIYQSTVLLHTLNTHYTHIQQMHCDIM